MKLLTSAKINLNLKVFPEKKDNFHKLSTVMIPIDIFDELEINESAEDLITYSDESLNGIESTVHKALKLLRKTNPKFDKNFYINVDKKIPYNSGLGGGSSDAGAVIRYLCDSYQLNLPLNLDIVREVGSDVPFFVHGVASKVEGIGEIINPLEIDKDLSLLVAVPKVGLSTKEVFNAYDNLSSTTNEVYVWNELEIFNDLWPASVNVYPEIKTIKDSLEEKYQNRFFMSGSGSSFFSIIDQIQEIKIEENLLNFIQVSKKIDCSLYQNDD